MSSIYWGPFSVRSGGGVKGPMSARTTERPPTLARPLRWGAKMKIGAFTAARYLIGRLYVRPNPGRRCEMAFLALLPTDLLIR